MCLMSRRTPPAPTRQVVDHLRPAGHSPPRAITNCTAVSRETVSAMPASSMISKVDRPIRCRPVRKVAMVEGPGELGEGVGADTGLLGEDGGRGGRRSQAEDLAAVLGPGQD